MAKVRADYREYIGQTFDAIEASGLLLASASPGCSANVMTIGAALLGPLVGKGIFMIYVRPSRYTYELIEQTEEFTVNVPPPALGEAVAYCGKVSGREHDKFHETGLSAIPAKTVAPPLVKECLIHYECRVIHKNDVVPGNLRGDTEPILYPHGDYHRLYFAEILATQVDKDWLRGRRARERS